MQCVSQSRVFPLISSINTNPRGGLDLKGNSTETMKASCVLQGLISTLLRFVIYSFRELIDSSFRKLRSAESALELFRSFESIKSRGALQQQVLGKTQDILMQFSRELDVSRSIFDVQRLDPPLARNQPPVAGSIKWSRCLFARTKQTMDKLSDFHRDLQTDSIGKN